MKVIIEVYVKATKEYQAIVTDIPEWVYEQYVEYPEMVDAHKELDKIVNDYHLGDVSITDVKEVK